MPWTRLIVGLTLVILTLVVLAFFTPGAARAADDVAVLPDVSVHLKGAHYAPAEPAFQWDGWIGAGAGLVRFDQTTLCFTADLETIIGNERKAFDANQASYHLELALRRPLGRGEVALVFHHVSRHLIDREKGRNVDWNIPGLRATAPLPNAVGVEGWATLGVGHTTQVSLVGYRWEVTARLEAVPLHREWGQMYSLVDARFVTTDSSPGFPRSHILDRGVEAGVRFGREGRSLQLYGAYEHREDVSPLVPGSRDRALLGFRIGFRGDGRSDGPILAP